MLGAGEIVGILGGVAIAQILPDATLGNPSVVNFDADIRRVAGGERAGGNLFHSFDRFNVRTGEIVHFDNPPTVDRIVTRVTGGQVSHIDGLIRSNGSADLFLINPSGLIFGGDARLEVGGSFIGSTADGLLFSNGGFYSATEPNDPPLLEIGVPIGLQWNGSGSGRIQVLGSGHQVRVPISDTGLPPAFPPNPSELSVETGNDFILIGGDVLFDGGQLGAESGTIELGSVLEGVVSWEEGKLDYSQVVRSGQIELFSRSSLDVSGSPSGSIGIHAGSLDVNGGSLLVAQNRGVAPGGDIRVSASTAQFSGVSTELGVPVTTALDNHTIASGSGGNILVFAQSLGIRDGAEFSARTFGTGESGNIQVESSTIEIEGLFFVSEDFLVLSSLNSIAFGSGNAGNIELFGERASLREGGSISSVTAGEGNSGDLLVRVGLIELTDGPTGRNQFGGLTTATVGNGDAGDLKIVTERLSLEEGNAIDSSTFSGGDAGNLEIVASEAIVVRPGIEPTVISSSALPFELESLRVVLGIPPRPEGDSGSVTLIAPHVEVSGGNSSISVRHEGTGDAGNLNIHAQMVRLNRGGRLTAATSSGRGGNITLDGNVVWLSRGSQITTSAGGIGNGGNITLELDVALILEESDIIADALEGVGGNVQITTPGLFANRPSAISASSRFGLDGMVQLDAPDLDPGARLVALQSDPLDAASLLVGDVCRLAQRRPSRFVNVGRGGIPPEPGSQYSAPVLEDWRIPEGEELEAADPMSVALEPVDRELVEAQGWYVNDAGKIVLTATPPADNFSSHRERGTSDCW